MGTHLVLHSNADEVESLTATRDIEAAQLRPGMAMRRVNRWIRDRSINVAGTRQHRNCSANVKTDCGVNVKCQVVFNPMTIHVQRNDIFIIIL